MNLVHDANLITIGKNNDTTWTTTC